MSKITWTIEKRKVVDLLPADYNPRKMSDQERKDLESSIKEFGTVVPVVVNVGKRKNTIIGGHQRVTIYADLKIEEVDVMIPSKELSIAEEKKLNLRLNKNTGSWDMEKLRDMGMTILSDIGFNNSELTDIFDDSNTKDDDFDVDEAVAKVTKTTIKYGDKFSLGRHVVMCGDATNEDDVKKLMGGVQAKMVFTDPPYNVDYVGTGSKADGPKRNKIENDKMNVEEFERFLNSAIRNMLEHCPGVFYICMSSKELASLKDVFEKNGGHWQSFIIWVKNTFTLSRSDWQNQYEPILYGWNGTIKNHYFAGFRDEGNVWENLEKLKPAFDGVTTTIRMGGFHLKIKGQVEGEVCRKSEKVDLWYEKKPTKSTEHPTMKPIKLVSKAIKASSERNDIVLDTFLGSGSTIIACEETGRVGYGMELEPKYVQVIIDRWEKFAHAKAKKL